MKSLSRIGLQIIILLLGWILFIILYPCVADEAIPIKTGNAGIRPPIGSQTPESSFNKGGQAATSCYPVKVAPPSNFRIVAVRKIAKKSPVHP